MALLQWSKARLEVTSSPAAALSYSRTVTSSGGRSMRSIRERCQLAIGRADLLPSMVATLPPPIHDGVAKTPTSVLRLIYVTRARMDELPTGSCISGTPKMNRSRLPVNDLLRQRCPFSTVVPRPNRIVPRSDLSARVLRFQSFFPRRHRPSTVSMLRMPSGRGDRMQHAVIGRAAG